MSSQTDAAILGMLTLQPMSGYDLKRFSEQSLTHFWHESYGNLYPRLKRLASAGLVLGRRETRERAPDAIVYRITAAGRRRFRAWLEEEPEPERVRNEMVLKVFFGARAEADLCRAHIAADRQRQEERLERYREIRAFIEAGEDHPDAPFWLMTLRRGELLTEARLRWCDESLRRIDTLHEVEA